jgi:hypothetical protein
MGKGIDFIINSVSIFKGLSAADYSHLETRFDKDSKTILTVNGGITSSIELDGLNKVIGEQEKKDAWEKLTSALGYLVDAGHTVDWGYTQNALESERQMEQFYSPLKATSKIIGLDLGDDLLAAEKTIAKYTRPESTFIYITTLGESTKEDMNEIKKAGGEYLKAFNFDIANAQSMLGILARSGN